jgi:hypothetical protein
MKPALSSLLVGLHAVGVLVIAGLGIAAWRIRCEGFGCIGVGVAWFAWTGAFLAWLAFGLIASRLAKGHAGKQPLACISIAVQLLVGLVPLGYWVVRNAA